MSTYTDDLQRQLADNLRVQDLLAQCRHEIIYSPATRESGHEIRVLLLDACHSMAEPLHQLQELAETLRTRLYVDRLCDLWDIGEHVLDLHEYHCNLDNLCDVAENELGITNMRAALADNYANNF